jgi:hypothetical protein
MATWDQYKGMYVAGGSTGPGGTNLTADLKLLADRAPFISTSDPTGSNDGTHDLNGNFFGLGSLWFNSNSQTMWVCLDVTTAGSAKWRSVWRRTLDAIVLAPVGPVTGTDARAAVLGGENNVAFSVDSVVAGGKGNNAGGGSGTITGVSIANPTVITSASHGLSTGETIAISGTATASSIIGNRVVTVTGTNTFTVPVSVISVTTGSGSWTTNATAAYAFVGGGQNNKAVGKWSHAEGFTTIASGLAAHSEGRSCSATGLYAHAEGKANTASGLCSHAEGNHTLASGNYSHAEGYRTTASGKSSHAEGYGPTSSGLYSHAEGKYSAASGYVSHAEGAALASGSYSHAEGTGTASGSMSHGEGKATVASGNYAHAGGLESKALLKTQWARASGGHSGAAGSAQTTITQLLRTTSGTTATELTLGGVTPSGTTGRLVVRNNQTLSCFINVVGRKVGAGSGFQGSFMRQVCICNTSFTTALVGSVQKIGTDINPDNWGTGSPADPISITYDDTDDFLNIQVIGKASTDIRWMATVFASEVADAAIS